MVLVLGIDRFMSEGPAPSPTCFGNTMATIFVAWWEGDTRYIKQGARAVLDRPDGVEEVVLAQ